MPPKPLSTEAMLDLRRRLRALSQFSSEAICGMISRHDQQ
jgi:hypothetical protein